MQIWRWLTLGLVVGALACSHGALARDDAKREFVPREIIVGFKSRADARSGIRDLRNPDPARLIETDSGTRLISVDIKRIDNRSARLICQFMTRGGVEPRGEAALDSLQYYVNELRKDPRVDYAHPNWVMRIQRERIRTPAYLDRLPASARKPREAVSSWVSPQPVPGSTTVSAPNDTVFRNGLHWHYGKPPMGMNAVAAWQLRAMGAKSVVIAVLDTGILPDHPDIRGSGNLLPGYDFISSALHEVDNERGRDPDPTDPGDRCNRELGGDSWHGTHVAGTIGVGRTNNNLGIAGINWTASVLPVRVLGRCGGTIDDIAAAVRWSAGLTVNGVPRNRNKADVINLSLGVNGACTRRNFGRLISAIEEARNAGSTIVVAAGNANTDIRNATPAGCRSVISVAASDQRGHLAPYSNHGDVTIMAPGGDLKRDDDRDGRPDGVWSLVAPTRGRPSGVAAYEGTSMAAPHVSGAIALAIASDSTLRRNPDRITALLTESAAELPRDACRNRCGPGLLNAGAMIQPDSLVLSGFRTPWTNSARTLERASNRRR